MKTASLPSVAELQRLFDYDSETGIIIRRFNDDLPRKINNRFAGKPTGWKNPKGYMFVGIGPTLFLAHRIAWKMTVGTEPEMLDHIDGDPSNNALRNLRPATNSENQGNRRRKLAKTLPKGVHATPSGRFKAEIVRDGERHHIGNYATSQEAHDAYCRAAVTLYGEFARFD